MEYSIQELSHLSGVTTRTLRWYDPARHRGIAELYVMDQRSTAYYDKQVPSCAHFLRDAIVHWVK